MAPLPAGPTPYCSRKPDDDHRTAKTPTRQPSRRRVELRMTRVIWVVKHLDGCADSWCWTAALARCEFDTLLTHSDEAHHRAVRRRGAVLVVVRRRRKTNDH